MISKDFNGVLRVWDVASCRLMDNFQVTSTPRSRMTPSADGRFVAWENGMLDTERRDVKSFADIGRTVFQTTLSPDGTIMACSTDDGQIILRDTGTGSVLHTTAPVADKNLQAIVFSRDGRRILTGGARSEMHENLSEGIYVYGILG
jgi:WD40 repeat protein